MSSPITQVMTEIAEALSDVGAPVVTDPSLVTTTPIVLVGPPRIEPTGTLCGDYSYSCSVLAIGLPGGFRELGLLAPLVESVLSALDVRGFGWSLAEPVDYTPLSPAGAADPCQAYRITVERLA